VAHFSCRRPQVVADDNLGDFTGQLGCRESAKGVDAGQAHPDETGVPIGNTDGNNPEKKRGWLWVMVTPALTMFHLALRRSGEMARQVLGEAFAGVVVTDR
jgi:hypothetical protein